MRILIAVGGVSQSAAAVRLGSLIHELTGGMLVLLRVINHESERPLAEAILMRAKQPISAAATEIRTHIRTGQPSAEIVTEAESGDYDLVIIGERMQHGLVRLLLAPTATRVIAHMPCPVLITRGKPHGLRRMLVCESGRDPSLLNRLIARLSPLLEHVDEVTVLHVMSQMAVAPSVSGWELRAEAQELIRQQTPEGSLLEHDLALLGQLNARLQAKVHHGLVVREILAEAQDGDYDLVVIGTNQGDRWERYLLDDLAHELISKVDRPLMVV